VEIIYEPVLLARTADAVFLEVHPDVYRRGIDPLAAARTLAAADDLLDAIDWSIAEDVIRKHDGIARDITRH
jgi:L,D-transpeptidase ErfK/SrfK